MADKTYENWLKSTAFYSMGQMANANAAAIAAKVRAEGSIYSRTLATNDPVAFSNLVGGELDYLRSSKRTDGFVNNLNYLQALLRSTGYSKGTTALGAFSYEDLGGLRKAIVEARANGVEYFTWLEDVANKGMGAGTGTSKYSKDISTAINLIDKTDATTTYTKGYFQAYGVYPSAEKIDAFMKKFNAQAKAQAVTTTTAGTRGTGSSKTTTTYSGQGFTAEEQANFLANYLSKDYAITPETGGAVKAILDDLRATYANNGLQEPAFESSMNVIKRILGTGDAKMAQQILDTEKQKIRTIAAKLNPGAADILNSGQDLNSITDQYIKLAEAATKKKYDINNPLIKQMINFKDEKGNIRNATNFEVLDIIRGSADWMKSPDAIATFGNIGDVIAAKLGR